MYRLWNHGFMNPSDRRSIREIRSALVESAQQDCLVSPVEEGPGSLNNNTRCAITADWEDMGRRVHTLFVAEQQADDTVTWMFGSAIDRPWNRELVPPLARLKILRPGFDLGSWVDAGGVELSVKQVNLVGLPPSTTERNATHIAGAILDKRRTTALMVLTEEAEYIVTGWAGIMQSLLIDEAGRVLINKLLPASRHIPRGGGVLYAAPCDRNTDQVFNHGGRTEFHVLEAAIGQNLTARQRSPLPGPWISDPLVNKWWTNNPLDLVALGPETETTANEQPQVTELDEARQTIAILHRRVAALDAGRRAALAEAEKLRETLAGFDTDTIASLRQQLQEVCEERDLLRLEIEDIEAERSTINWSRAAMSSPDNTEQESVSAVDEQQPEHGTFRELLDDARERFRALEITADYRPAVALDQHTNGPQWRRKTWDALMTLNAYAVLKKKNIAATGTGGASCADVLSFIKAGQPGAIISAAIVSMTEGLVEREGPEKLRQARLFPVREETDPSGFAFFYPHVRIERFKSPAPRLHFYDDTDNTGVVYIGYIGEHLPNAKTN